MRNLLLLVLLAGLAGCGRDLSPPRPPRGSIPPGSFAALVTELGVARSELLPDTAAYRARRDQILARYGVTAGQLRAAARAYAPDEDVLLGVYELERARLDSLFGTGATAPPSTGVAPPAAPEEPAADTTR